MLNLPTANSQSNAGGIIELIVALVAALLVMGAALVAAVGWLLIAAVVLAWHGVQWCATVYRRGSVTQVANGSGL